MQMLEEDPVKNMEKSRGDFQTKQISSGDAPIIRAYRARQASEVFTQSSSSSIPRFTQLTSQSAIASRARVDVGETPA